MCLGIWSEFQSFSIDTEWLTAVFFSSLSSLTLLFPSCLSFHTSPSPLHVSVAACLSRLLPCPLFCLLCCCLGVCNRWLSISHIHTCYVLVFEASQSFVMYLYNMAHECVSVKCISSGYDRQITLTGLFEVKEAGVQCIDNLLMPHHPKVLNKCSPGCVTTL